MKTVLLYDCETSGLDPSSDHVVEVAGVRWSIEDRAALDSFSCLVRADSNAAESVNGITVAMLQRHGRPWGQVVTSLASWIKRSDLVIAHNADFDAAWLPDDVRGLRPWACSCGDIAWPRASGSLSLGAVAAAHKVAVVEAHRASVDVDILRRLFDRVAELGADVEAMLTRALRPKVLVVAKTPKPWEMPDEEWSALKSRLGDAGFRFDGDRKEWRRRMPPEDIATLPFPAEIAA